MSPIIADSVVFNIRATVSTKAAGTPGDGGAISRLCIALLTNSNEYFLTINNEFICLTKSKQMESALNVQTMLYQAYCDDNGYTIEDLAEVNDNYEFF